MLYALVKYIVKTGLYSYHKRINVIGLEHIPVDKPILFLPNHQSALLDVLLIATTCRRKPNFLTRADVFSNPVLNRVFDFFKMLPIYRIRDGRKTLKNNHLIFDKCADLLANDEALVIFPEANHSLKRRVRPLSKGFTRIILQTFEKYPHLDIQLVPVGLNYKNAEHFPDKVAIFYGNPIAAKNLYDQEDLVKSSREIKSAISSRLKELTTHIPEEMDYNAAIETLGSYDVNFLKPGEVNDRLRYFKEKKVNRLNDRSIKTRKNFFMWPIFILINFPVVLIWKLMLKPKVPEAEFSGTFRFVAGLLLFPSYLILLFFLLTFFLSFKIALLGIVVLIVLNVVLVKFVLY